MKEYEVIHEIINQCPMNHSRDQFFDEIECEDPEEYVRNKFRGRDFSCDKIIQNDGSIVFEVMTSGIHQRFTFTEI
jgi:hypothetical protein